MKFPLLYILLSLVIFSSCSTLNMLSEKEVMLDELPEAFLIEEDYQYQIRKNDKITVSIWGQDEISVGSTYGIYNSNEVYGKWLMVDAEGNIEIPKIGTYHILGKTIIETKRDLQQKISKWIKTPVIDIKILNREITILGEVRDPQVINVDKEDNRLMDVIAQCKGFDFYADIRKIKVLRQYGPDVHVAHIDLTTPSTDNRENLALLPGDIVLIPSKKHKDFDKRVSTIIPFTSTMTAAAILFGAF